MIPTLINRTIDNRWLFLGLALILIGFGVFAALHLPVDAYPDISPQKAWIVTSYPGRAAEEVERQITIPIEIVAGRIAPFAVTAFGGSIAFGNKSVTFELAVRNTHPVMWVGFDRTIVGRLTFFGKC